MLRIARFPGLLLTAAVLLAGCTSTPSQAPVAGASSRAGTETATTEASATHSSSSTPSSTPTKRTAKPSVSPTVSATPTVTATPTATATRSATPTATPTTKKPTPTPTVTDPIVAGAYAFPVAGCHTSYGSSHHDYPATDIFAARNCHYVAPTAGVVDEVTTVNKWSSGTNKGADRGGLSVSIVGDDGVRYYGSHLTSVAAGIGPGVRVGRGQLLGYVGDTGSARGTGTHLHFGISWPTPAGYWWVRRGWVSPYTYLNAWKSGVGKSPSAAVAAAETAAGDYSKCHRYC
ncbi:MAG: peptidase [Frankiales bacterium]|nr:peptidase [Frankiales bacterium]